VTVPLEYDNLGRPVFNGRFWIEYKEQATLLSVLSKNDYLCIQPVQRGRKHTDIAIDQGKPQLIIDALNRNFLYYSLLVHKKVEVEVAGPHCGVLQLETHWQSPHYGVVQLVTTVNAQARYTEEGLDFSVAGSVARPAHIPTSFPEGGSLPSRWPSAFNVHVKIQWEALPFLLGHAHYFLRIRDNFSSLQSVWKKTGGFYGSSL